MRKVDWIVIHCTGAAANQTVASIERHWREVRGWRNPGYHRLITLDGTVHELAPYSAITNGVAGFNANAIHICYTGGVDSFGRIADTRTTKQKEALLQLVQEAAELFPEAVIQGHRDFSPDKNRNGVIEPEEWIKACPSFSVKKWLHEVNFRSHQRCRRYFTTTTRVNIRAGAGVAFETVAPTLAAATRVQFLGCAADWLYVQVNGVKGWVSAQFLQEEAT